MQERSLVQVDDSHAAAQPRAGHVLPR
jgi:hypothetical protein